MWNKYRRTVLGAVVGAALGYRLVNGNRTGLLHGSAGYFGGIHTPWLVIDPALDAWWQFLIAAFVVFALFSIYWEVASKNSAESKSAESTPSRGIHVVLTNLALLLEILPIRGLGRLFPPIPAVMCAGIAVELVGLAIAIWARRHLGANWSGRISIKVEPSLIRTGPYRSLRHPIYTGILAMYFGLAIVTGERLGAIGFALALVAYIRKIRLEEGALDAAFGAEYDSYRRESWAVIPWFW